MSALLQLRVWRRALATACTLAGVLALSATPALAARGHEYTATFAKPCMVEPCTGEELKEPNGVAVNEATGDVYVVDTGEAGGAHGRVVRFSKEDVFLSEFNGSGTLLNGKGELFEGKAAGSGGEPGEIETGRFEAPNEIAVDNSCALRNLSAAACTAADPSNGDVYVVDAGEAHRVIDKYSPTGEYLGQITEAGGTSFQGYPVRGVAIDAEGTVSVYREPQAVVDRFTNAAPNVFIAPQITLNSPGIAAPGFAVDSKGNFYGAIFVHSQPQVAKWDPSGNILIDSLGGEGANGVGVDQRSDGSFVSFASSVEAFSPEGALLETLGEEHGEKHLSMAAGIGVNAGAASLYVADAESGNVVLFGPAKPSTPKVESESFEKVTSTSVSFAAEINPRSEASEPPSEFHFQYGRCASATTCATSGYEAQIPVPGGEIPADFDVHSVAAQLEGLSPGTTYHFRVLAKNSHGEGEAGAEETFTTQGVGGQLTLPDSRGWELVSPPDKLGALVLPIAEIGVVQAAASGDRITYLTNSPIEAQPQGVANDSQVLSSRAAASWTSRDIAIPHAGPTGAPGAEEGPEYKFFDTELTTSAVQPYGEFIPQLSGEASESTAYLHELSDSCGPFCFHPLVSGRNGFANVPAGTAFGEQALCEPKGATTPERVCGPRFLGASDDMRHVVLTATAALAPGAPPGSLYEWSGGTLAPVSVPPGPGEGATTGYLGFEGSRSARRAISADGTRIVWHTPIEDLYTRDTGRGETVALDKAEVSCEAEALCESGGGRFEIASSDGSRVFFTDTKRLTSDSGANPTGIPRIEADLYECNVAAVQPGEENCSRHLTDLTPKHGEEGANVQGSVLGASEDGEYIYFVAKGVQSGANGEGKSPTAGQPNLYLRHGAATNFVATLAVGDEHDWDVERGQHAELASQPTRVSGNGRFLELMSQGSPTGYDNTNRMSASGQPEPVAEVYLYDAAAKRLSCASCEPSGQRPVGVEYRKLEPGSGGLAGGPRGIWPQSALVAANVPGWTDLYLGKSRYQPRYLDDEGRLFFNSADALMPQDSNGTQDVYQYELPGVGDCSEASATYSARSGGCVSLISSGASAQESAFLDASESGNDVFFLTSAKLSKLDTDTSRDVYDAHVCTTGSPCITYQSNETPPCTTEASCKASPTPQPSIFGAPASATFQGAGNPTPPAVVVKPKTAAQLRAEKLKKALKACRRKHGHKRAACEKQARKHFGAKHKAKKSVKSTNRKGRG